MSALTFIVDCPHCRAKVGVEEKGRVHRKYWIEEAGEPDGHLVQIGQCPRCNLVIVGRAAQTGFDGFEGEVGDAFADSVRVFPNPPKSFTSHRIPKVVKDSLSDGDKSLQSGANMAACVMFGRALEAVCRHVLSPKDPPVSQAKPKHIMLAQGIKMLRDKKIIDDRLFDWSGHLQAFRNLSAHPEEGFSVSREDAEDLQVFVYAIIEYIYDLADRYDEFKARIARRAARPKKPPSLIFDDDN
jgi:hypothetical protein